jgi:hypothetical protein
MLYSLLQDGMKVKVCIKEIETIVGLSNIGYLCYNMSYIDVLLLVMGTVTVYY